MTETAVKGVQERINYFTRLVMASLALLAVVGGGLIAEIRSKEFDILFAIGGGIVVLLFIMAGYLVKRVHDLIKELEKQ